LGRAAKAHIFHLDFVTSEDSSASGIPNAYQNGRKTGAESNRLHRFGGVLYTFRARVERGSTVASRETNMGRICRCVE
jgi:hypothetical protein